MADRTARAAIRIPYALAGVVVTLLIQLVAIVWLGASFQTEMRSGISTLTIGQQETKKEVERLTDRMYTQADATRDRADTHRQLIDHESRLRDLERGQRMPTPPVVVPVVPQTHPPPASHHSR